MKTIKLRKREKDLIALAKKGYSFRAMSEYYGANYHAVCSIAKSLYKKLGVRSVVAMLAKLKRMEEEIPVLDIAKEEWNKLYPQGDLITMTQRERDFSWEHWLRAWQLAEKRFKDTTM